MNKALRNYEEGCMKLCQAFIEDLYPDEDDRERILKEGEGWWIGGAVGEVYCWWDWFVYANHMADYFKYKLTPNEFFEWYDQWVENSELSSKKKKQKPALNMKHFKISQQQ